MGSENVPTARSPRRIIPLPVPFLGHSMTETEIQNLVRKLNNLHEDVRVLTYELQKLKEEVEELKPKPVEKPIPKTPEEKRAFSREWDRRYAEGQATAAKNKASEAPGSSEAKD